MPSETSIMLFAVAALVLVVVPGPSVLYIIGRGASQGPRAGVISAAGIQTGSLVHVAAAVAGLSTLLAASATAFTVVKVVGGGYLIYLGVKAIRSGDRHQAGETQLRARSYRRIFRDGVIVNVLNPKTAIFFLAFLPQFVDPARGAVTGQLLVLGLVFVAVGFVSDATYGLVSGWAGDALRRRRAARSSRTGSIASGVLFIGLGTTTILSGHRA